MFARILIIAAHTPDETDWHARFALSCTQLGHAVRIWCPPEHNAEAALAVVCDAFRPTLALWTAEAFAARMAYALAGPVRPPCLTGLLALRPFDAMPGGVDFVMSVGPACRESAEKARAKQEADGKRALPVIALEAAVDARYLHAKISDPAVERGGVSFDQACTPQRRTVAETAEKAAGTRSLFLHPSWRESVNRACPGANESYWRRTCSFYSAFDGEDSPSEAQLALRAAEGSIVCVERRGDAPANAGSFLDACEFHDADELSRVIARFAKDADARKAALARQRAALARQGLLESAVARALEACDLVARRLGHTPVLAYREAVAKVVMYGWFGARNFGDDLLLSSTIARIEERRPNTLFCVIGANAAVIENEYGYQATTPDRKYEVRAALDGACAMVLCGGLLFDDPLAQTAGEMEFCLDPWIEPTGQAALCLLARSLGVPSVYLGFGAGPIDNRATRIAVNLIARSDAVFLPRDEHTAGLLRECGVDQRQVRVCADLILGAHDYIVQKATSAPGLKTKRPFFTVSLRHWHRNPPDFARTIAQAVDAVVEKTELMALFLPFDQDDASLHQQVVSHMRHTESTLLMTTRPDEADLLSILKRSRFAFAMRLHCSIIHHVLGKPAVGLNYNDKIEAHFRRFDQQGLLLELDASCDAMVDALLCAARWTEEDLDALSRSRQDAACLVDGAFDTLFAAMETPLPRPTGDEAFFPRKVSSVESNLRKELFDAWRRAEESDARRRRLEEENAALRAEVDAVRRSRSYRFGNAFMRIPHAVAARLASRKK